MKKQVESPGLTMKYFVLNPTKDDAYGEASRRAMEMYADVIEHKDKLLAVSIRLWVQHIEGPSMPTHVSDEYNRSSKES